MTTHFAFLRHHHLRITPTTSLSQHASHAQIFSRKSQDSVYNSLRDPHLRKYFEKTPSARSHLVDAGLITEDGRVLGTAAELWQGVKVYPSSIILCSVY